MLLTRHQTPSGPRWAADGRFLPRAFTLDLALEFDKSRLADAIRALLVDEPAAGVLLPPVEPTQEVWASGVTYLRSRDARKAESTTGDIYQKVYEAERPELFFKAAGWRVVGPGDAIRVRADSRWNVPEPELTLVVNAHREVIGYTAGNDVSSRDIEGENPLYLPQAKVYDGSCALGPGIVVAGVDEMRDLSIGVTVLRDGVEAFTGETRTSQMKRSFEDLVEHLGRELDLRHGAFLMTGTGIVPPPEFSLAGGDVVRITIGRLTLENPVA